MAKEGKVIANIDRGGQTAPARWMGTFDDIGSLFDEFLSRGFLSPGRGSELTGLQARAPKVDVIDREHEFLVRAEVPGIDKKDLDVSVNENMVTIKAEHAEEHKEEKGDYYRREISRGTFARTVALPAFVDSDKAKASFKDGVLELTLPKMEQSRRKKIDIG